MSQVTDISTGRSDTPDPLPFRAPRRRWRRSRDGRPRKPRVRKLRLLLLFVGLGTLAAVSLLFGMLMAVASDLPQLENRQQYKKAINSYLYDDHWHPIGILAPANNVVLVQNFDQISPWMRRAIVAVEDRRFWADPGIDLRGVARAAVADIGGHATQGASTIAEQFVKNALAEQDNRTVFEKLREAALAFHLAHRWSKQKILREYLNTIYFGNGAYGIESAARVYFGRLDGYDPNANIDGNLARCGAVGRPMCASLLTLPQAALLAGMVANPSGFDPVAHPQAAFDRRQLVLQDMLAQRYITQAEYEQARRAPLPTAQDVEQPQEPSAAPYFTSWVAPQILDAVGRGVPASVAEYRAYYGGLKIRTTLDLPMQQAADQAIAGELPIGAGEPTASLVAIDNATGQVRAMVGGPLVDGHEDYSRYPFNLATEGERQPGSAFKPFTLAVALEHGYTPDSVIDSHPLTLVVPHSGGKELYHVKNFGNQYSGPITLAQATAVSDNSVFTQVGVDVGTGRIARMATAMGIRTPVSRNYAMIIGGLKVGVSPLDMAHAYETIADGGNRIYTPVLGSPKRGPVGITQVTCPPPISCNGRHNLVAIPHLERVIPPSVAQVIHELLVGVVSHGTGTQAAISGVDVAGKTGTTSDYGDAWFVGWTPQLTTAVWVGFPNRLVPMSTLYNGGPVEGGTFPALIWRDFMERALQIYATEQREYAAKAHARRSATGTTAAGTSAGTGTSPGSTAPQGTGSSPPAGGTGTANGAGTNPSGNGATGNGGGSAGTGTAGATGNTGNGGGTGGQGGAGNGGGTGGQGGTGNGAGSGGGSSGSGGAGLGGGGSP